MAKRYSCIWITGASAGLGEEFARQLAPRANKIILVARREDRLKELAADLEATNDGLAVGFRVADLSDPAAREALIEEVRSGKESVDLLINNAGLGDYGEFTAGDWSNMDLMLQVNIVALTHLCHGFLPHMGEGSGIINVSSLASTMPIPDFAAYAATKAYVSSLSEAIRIEQKERGVTITALCPGPVHTEFGTVAARNVKEVDFGLREAAYVDKAKVVAKAIDALDRDRARVFPGLLPAAVARLVGAMPMSLVRLVMSRRPRRES